jgi:hypothetical protein
MTNKFVRYFIREHKPCDEGVDWLRKAKPYDMRELWRALLDWQQDSSIIIERRIGWAIWLVGRTNGAGALAELAWRFANGVYDKMSAESQAGMSKIHCFLNGDQTVDIQKLKLHIQAAAEAGYAYADFAAVHAAEAAEDAACALRAARKAGWVTVWAGLGWDAENARRHQLEIIRQYLLEKGYLTPAAINA